MIIKPVETAPAPDYPDKYAEETRQALAAARPRRWISTPLAAGLAATVAIGLSGCGERAVMGVMIIPTELETKTADAAGYMEEASRLVAANTYIPLFEYGEGTGSIGCMSVAAPVFMSEEEAFAILSTAFAEAGIMLRKNSKSRQAVLPVTIINEHDEKASKTKKGILTPDALADETPIEFVSQGNIKTWEYKPKGPKRIMSSVNSYSTKGAAQILAENNPGLIVFYDPVTYWTEDGERFEEFMDTEEDARAESEKLLRAQATAFLQWLQAGGELA